MSRPVIVLVTAQLVAGLALAGCFGPSSPIQLGGGDTTSAAAGDTANGGPGDSEGADSITGGGDSTFVGGGDSTIVGGGDSIIVGGGDSIIVSGGDTTVVSGGDTTVVSGGDTTVVSGGDETVVPFLQDGEDCSAGGNAVCLSNYCDGSLCCAQGDCCNNAQDCPPSYTQGSSCDNASSNSNCQGHALVADCVASTCGSTSVNDDSDCDGVVADCPGNFDPATCTNEADQSGPACLATCTIDPDCLPGFFCSAGDCDPVPVVIEACVEATTEALPSAGAQVSFDVDTTPGDDDLRVPNGSPSHNNDCTPGNGGLERMVILIATENIDVDIQAPATNFDPVLWIERDDGQGCANNPIIDCNDDDSPPGGLGSRLLATLVAGETYHLFIDGYETGDFGVVTITITAQ